jgi:hypothetical protein
MRPPPFRPPTTGLTGDALTEGKWAENTGVWIAMAAILVQMPAAISGTTSPPVEPRTTSHTTTRPARQRRTRAIEWAR